MRPITRLFTRLLALWLIAVPTAASAAEPSIPRSLNYTFLVGGKPVGQSHIRVTRTQSSLLFESTMRVDLGGNVIELACRTDADPTTFGVRSFSYQGTKGGTPVASNVHVDADSVYGTIRSRGADIPKVRRVSRYPDVVVFEDWVPELQVLWALHQARDSRNSTKYRLVFANSFLPTDALAGYTGEVLVEAPGRSVTARRLTIDIQGGQPYESLVDARGVPLYLRFPAVGAEMFLDEFFGENPTSRFSQKTPRAN